MAEFLHNLPDHMLEDIESYPRISYSEANSWTRCQRQWQYQYRDGYTSASTPSYFSRGHYLHGLMANLLEGKTMAEAHEATLTKIREEDGGFEESSIQDDIERLQQQAQEVTHDILIDNEVVGLEMEFFYQPEGEDFLVHGFIDAVLRNSHGELWIVDFKTAGRKWSESQFLMSTQDVLYAQAVSVCMGEQVQGTTYVIFAPTGLDFKIRRVTPEGMHAVEQDIISVAGQRKAALNSGATSLPMAPLWGCGGCPFQQTCRTTIAGGDVEYMLSTSFIVDEERVERTRINGT